MISQPCCREPRTTPLLLLVFLDQDTKGMESRARTFRAAENLASENQSLRYKNAQILKQNLVDDSNNYRRIYTRITTLILVEENTYKI
jgi:hypothetical protein